ncbi:VCBS domain-containing protein [Shewanella xiamenensis]|uniref:VCBS domain-containing protein n=2 Tax=Shewanella xiamenensis TaxID=332186 RepID=UPI0024A732E5|nr:VCBS domain-containing protein [Shewanella xiamenensis]MDI5876512.1 VCBS domain-containing protein [Shewanella xiamenensis]
MSPKKPLTLSTAKRKSRISAKLAKKSEIAAKKLDKDVAKLKAKEFRESAVKNSATPDIVATQSWRLATHATTQLANTEQSTEQKSNSQSTTADIDNRHSTVQTASNDPEKTLLEQQQQENAAETQTTIIPKFQDYGSSESTHLGQGPHFDDTQPPLVTLSQLPEIGDIKQQIEPTALTVSMARTTLTQSVRPPIISTEQHHTPLSIDEQVTHQSIKEDAPAASISGKLHAHGEAITSLQWTVAEHQGQFGRLDIDPITGEWHYQLDNNAPKTDGLAEGEHQTEQFTVTVSGPNGEQVSTIIVIDVEGSNDLPQILGSHLASINASDALQTVMGQLRSVDPDHNDVITWAVLDGQGQYGQLSINPLTGQWQYQLNNHANATLALVSGQQVTETFTVTATDQSGHPVSQQVSIQVNGADDAAIIQGEMTGLVTEDTQTINGQLTVSGQLSIQDPDKNQAHFSADSLQGQFGYLTIDVNGHWIYNADNTQATIQSLRSGEHLTDTFIIHSADGTAQNITVTINGTDDKAEISGTTSASLTEDSDTYQGMLRSNGNLTITDNDHGPHLFTATEQSGQFGTLTIDELGHWTYIADNSQTEIQALKTGESITDTLVVQTQDGTQQTISITIHGTDDHSVIRGTSVVRVFEDKRLSQGQLHTDGQLWVSNPDTGRAGFAAEQRQGQFGVLSISSDGHWTYTADNNNPSIQALKHGEFVTETLFVKALDGTPQKIEILIKGADDKAIIGGADTATLIEDQSVQHGQLQAHGTLTITDPDAGQAQFSALTDVAGSAGYGHFSIDATGNWTYTVDNTLTAIQQLNTGEHLTDSLTISSADGTNHTLTVTITGSNDAPVVAQSLVTTTATEDTAFSFSIPAGTFADIDTGDTLILSTGSLPAWLHFDAATGTFSGTPTNGDVGTLQVTITATDGSGAQVSTIFMLNVDNTNDAPSLTPIATVHATEDGAQVTGQFTATDPDSGDTLTFSIAQPVDGLTVNTDGSWRFDPSHASYQHLAAGQTLTLTMPVTVTDAAGATGSQDLVIKLNGSNDGATIGGVSTGSAKEDNAQITTGQLIVADVDDGEAHFVAQTDTAGTYGHFSLSADGRWSYQLDNSKPEIQQLSEGVMLHENFNVHSADGTTHTITVDIVGTNDAPVLAAQSQSVTEDGNKLSGQMVATDVDTGDSQTFSTTAQTAGFTLNADGSYSFDPANAAYQHLAAGQTETLTIPITVTDSTGATSTANLTITLTGSNDGAVISGTDAGTVTEDTQLTTGGQLTVTDIDDQESAFTAQANTAGSYGSFTLAADGHWTYTLDNKNSAVQALGQNATLTDSLTVQSVDGTAHTVTVTINGHDDGAVIAGVDSGTVTEDANLTAGQLKTRGQLTISDPDADQDHFTAQTNVAGSYGTFSLDQAGHWTYVSDNSQTAIQQLKAGETLTDSLTVQSVGGTTHTVTVTITGSNDAPVLTAQSQSVTEDGSRLSGQMVATDVDTGDTLTFSLANAVDGFTLNADGSYSFDPTDAAYQHLAQGQTETLSIPITVTDSTGATSTANLTITLTGSNDGAIISGTDADTVNEDTQLTTQGQLTVTDIDDQESAFTAQANTAGSYGCFTLATDGHWTYTLDNSLPAVQALGQNGTLTDSLTVQSVDGTTHKVTVTINGHDDGAVIAGVDSGTVTEDANLTAGQLETHGQLTISDPDAGQDHFTAQTNVAGSYGTFSLDADGQWHYSADNSQSAVQQLKAGETLTDSLTVQSVGGTTHTVTVTLTGTNDVPVLTAQRQSVTEDGTKLSGQMVATDMDTSDSQTFSTTAQTAGFTLNADGSYSFDPSNAAYKHLAQGQTETLSIPVSVTDSAGATATQQLVITVTGSNDGAIISGTDASAVTEDTQLTTQGQLTVTDIDEQESAFTAQAKTAGSYGSFTLAADGQWTYTLDNSLPAVQALGQNATLTDSLTVQSMDGTTHTITVTINGHDDGAVIAGVDSGTVTEDSNVKISGLISFSSTLTVSDIDTGEARFPLQQGAGSLGLGNFLLAPTGGWGYSVDNNLPEIQQLKAGQTLVETYTFHSADGSQHTVTVTITGSNDAPVLTAQSQSFSEDGSKLSGQMVATDVDTGDTLTFSLANAVDGFTLNADGSYSFDPSNAAYQHLAAGQTETLTIPVNVTDSAGATATQQLVITVTGSNDGAVISGTDAGAVTEDMQLTTGGQLTVTDIDDQESAFTAQANTAGSYGSFTLAADGHWTYTLDNSLPAVQALGQNATLTDSLTVQSVDGTTHTITVTINGHDDGAVITGVDSGTVTEDSNVTTGKITTSGQLTISDPDAGQDHFTAQTNVAGSYGTFSLDQAGHWTYVSDNSQTAIQQLKAGETLTDSLTVLSVGGTTHTVTVIITGSNDAPVLTAQSQSVSEDGNKLSGQMVATDVDTGDTLTFSLANSVDGFTLNADGSYSFDPSNVAYQHLVQGQTETLSIPITVTDSAGATSTANLTITLTGSNDGAIISGTDASAVTEDTQLTTQGQLTVTDIDDQESAFTAQVKTAGSYGSFTLAADGHWTYTLDNKNSAVQALGQNATLTDSLTVQSVDGTTHTITVTINGHDDGAVIAGVDSGTVTEDANLTAGQLETHGQLTISDPDAGQDHFTAQTNVAGSYGTFSLDADGQWHYSADNSQTAIQQLKAGETLTDSLTVQSVGGTTHTVTITLTGSNDAPVLTLQSQSVTEDGSLLTGQMVATDVDTGDTLTFSLANSVDGFTLNADGSYSFDPSNAAYQHLTQSQTQNLTIPVTVTDSAGATSTQNLTLNLTGSNDGAIISGTDAGTVTEDTQLTTGGQLTVTDIDDLESAFTAQANTAGSYGSFTLAADGHWTYTLDNKNSAVQALGQNATLTDSLTVQSVDGTTHTITVTINGHDDGAVIAGVDSGTVTEDANLTAGQLETHGQLTISDPDAGQDHFTAQTNVAGSYGTFSLDADGQWHYSADNSQTAIQQLKAGATLTDSFTVTSADGTNHTVTVTLTGSNDAPVLTAQSQSVMEDGSRLSGQMVATDVDQGDTLHFSIGTRVAGFTLNADGSYNFDPSNAAYQHLAAGQTQTLAIPVTVTDSAGATSTANLTITLTGTNDGATITDHGTPGQIKEDQHTAIEGHLSVGDVDSGEGLFPAQQGAGLSGYGSFTLTPQANGQAYWRYSVDNSKTEIQQLGEGQLLHDSFTVHSADGTTHTISVDIVGTNDAPVLTAQSQSVTEDGSLLTGQMVATDVDTGDTLTFSLANSVDGFTLNADGSYSFEPIDAAYQHLAQGQTETLTIPVSVTDSAGATSTQQLVITVSGSNDGAVISGIDAGSVTEDTQLTTAGQLTVTDIDDQEAAFTAQTKAAGSYGSFTLAADGHWTYTLDNTNPTVQALSQTGTLTDSLTVQSVDGTTHQITVTINGHDDGAVIAGVDSGTVTEDANLTAGQLETRGQLTITDPDAGQNHFTAQTNVAGSYGSFSLDADGQWYYSADNSQTAIQQLKAGETLTDSLNIQSVGGTTHTVTVTITGSNDAPVLIAQSQSVTEDGTKLSGQMVATDVDTGDTLTFSLANSVDGFTLNADGSYSFEPIDAAYQHLAQGQTETLTIPVSVTDSAGATATQQLVITVSGSNDGAVISGTDAGAVTEDTQLTTAGQLTVTDIDDQEAAFTAQTKAAGSYGSFTLAADGHWTYTLDNTNPTVQALSQTGTLTDSLTVQSVDGTTHQITVTINGHDDGAVIAGVDSGTVTEDANLTADQLETHGKLTITDPDTGQDHFTAQTNVAGSYGTFSLDADGQWHYSADNSQTAIQQLKAGETLTDSITVQSVGGTTHTVTITINGHDDGAVIAGVDSGTVTEDANLTAGQLETHGQLTISDPDAGQDHFTAQTNVAGSYGTFSLDADGQWRYSADNSQSAIQQLKAGETLTDSFTVTSADGTNHAVTVTLTGSNDAPVLTAQSQSVSEDGAKLTGQMVATDVDTGDTLSFSLANSVDGFTLNADGSYSFDPSNAAYQHLAAGQTQDLVIPVTVTDSAGASHTQNLTITVTGVNDGAVISGAFTGAVTEDQSVQSGQLQASGQLTITDADSGESHFIPQTDVLGSDGLGRFSLDAQGHWSYSADNSQKAIQQLAAGATLNDSFTVQGADGALHTVTVTLTGSNDAPQFHLQVAPDYHPEVESSDVLPLVINNIGSSRIAQYLDIQQILQGQAPIGAYANTCVTVNLGGLALIGPDGQAAQVFAAGQEFKLQTLVDWQQQGPGHEFRVFGPKGTTELDLSFHDAGDPNHITGPQGQASLYVNQVMIWPPFHAWQASAGSSTSTGTASDSGLLTATEGGPALSGQFHASDIDVGDTLAFSLGHPVDGFTLNADGSYSFDPSNAAYQHLAAGQSETLSIPITVTDSAGASTTQTLTILLRGANDAATFGGVETGATQEDRPDALSGQLTVADADDGEAHFIAQSGTAGSYGQFSLDENGQWHYQSDNSKPEVQALRDGQSVTDSFTVRSADGTVHTVNISIAGKNDAAVITGEDHQTLTEDQNVSGGQLIAHGQLHASTPDAGGDQFTPLQDLAGKFGQLSLSAGGSWVYKADNSSPAVQALHAGQSATESFTVHSVDGTAHTISINIQGADESRHDILSSIVSTLKSNWAPFKQIGNAIDARDAGSLGNVVLSFYGGNPHVVDADGHVLASGSNKGMFGYDISLGQVVGLLKSHPGAQLLLDGQTGASSSFYLHDSGNSMQLTFAGNARYNVHDNTLGSVPIDGLPTPLSAAATVPDVSDSLTISVTDISVDHAGQLQTSGQLSISDADAGENHFNAQNDVAGTYGSFSIDASGHWVYSVDNGQAAVQNLQAGAQLTDSFMVTSADGTSHVVSVAVYGKNDAPVLFAQSQSVSEDGAQLSGQMHASDADAGDTLSFRIDQPVAGFALKADGSYSFDPSNAAYQHLAEGQTETLTIPITVTDHMGASSVRDLTITLTGKNDAAVITGVDQRTVTEDQDVDGFGNLHVTGQLQVDDPDGNAGPLQFQQQNAVQASYGHFTLNADGYWLYEADNKNPAIQQLKTGESLTDTLTAHSADGTSHTITVTIQGQDDAAAFVPQAQAAQVSSSDVYTIIGVQLMSSEHREFQFMAEVLLGNTDPRSYVSAEMSFTNTSVALRAPDGSLASVYHAAGGMTTVPLMDLRNWHNKGQGYDVVLVDATGMPVNVFPHDLGDPDKMSGFNQYVTGFSGPFNAAVVLYPDTQAASSGGAVQGSAVVPAMAPVLYDAAHVQEDNGQQISGFIEVQDADQGQSSMQPMTDHHAAHGTFSIDVNGDWVYQLDSSRPDVQALKDGETLIDTITVHSADGTPHKVNITIHGQADGAVISGVDSGSMIEDGSSAVASGQLSIVDPDAGEAHFLAQANVSGQHGHFSLLENGAWTYTLDNKDAAVQALKAGESLTEHLTVSSVDGTTHVLTVTVQGSNDAPVLQAQSQSVTEDGSLLHGKMVAQDGDHGDALRFSTPNAVGGFTLNADGSYSFDPSHHDYQSLGAGQTRDIAIPITVTDSAGATATQMLNVHITGRDDRTSIYGVDSGSVQAGVHPETSGDLHASDDDAGQSGFRAGTVNGSFGRLSIDAQGHWTYWVDGSDPFVMHLLPNSHITEQLTVHSVDGTAHDIEIEVSGPPGGGQLNAPVDNVNVQYVALPQVWDAYQAQTGVNKGGHEVFAGILAAVRAGGYQYQGLADELDKGNLAVVSNMDVSISGVHVQVVDAFGHLVQNFSPTTENAATLHMSDVLNWHAQGYSILASSDSGLDSVRLWLHNTGDMHTIQVQLPSGTGFNAWADQWIFGELQLHAQTSSQSSDEANFEAIDSVNLDVAEPATLATSAHDLDLASSGHLNVSSVNYDASLLVGSVDEQTAQTNPAQDKSVDTTLFEGGNFSAQATTSPIDHYLQMVGLMPNSIEQQPTAPIELATLNTPSSTFQDMDTDMLDMVTINHFENPLIEEHKTPHLDQYGFQGEHAQLEVNPNDDDLLHSALNDMHNQM